MKSIDAGAPGFRRRELAASCLFPLLSGLLSVFKAVHIDEPLFLAPITQILRDPWRPSGVLGLTVSPAGRGPPLWTQTYVHSVLICYFLALAMKAARGSFVLARLFCLPVDAAAGGALYCLSARVLKRPFWPTLLILAGPAWLLGMPMLMAEKWIVCLQLLSAAALLASLDRDSPSLYWLSAASISLAVALKFTTAFMLPPLALVQWSRKVPPRRIAGYLLACAAPVALDALLLEPHRLLVTWALRRGVDYSFHARVSRLRALLAFPAACALVPALWPYARYSTPRPRVRALLLTALGASVVVFAPFLDAPGLQIRVLDRLLGVFFACGTLAVLCRLSERRSRRLPGWWLWMPWILGGLAASGMNWFTSSRSILLLLPALILAGGERLEAEADPRALRIFYRACFAGLLLLSASLGLVDAHYAEAQRAFAQTVKARYVDQGRRVWFTGHWGFRYYMERAGALELDPARGGWAEVKAGDLVTIPFVNTNQLLPPVEERARIGRRAVETISEPIPLRLMDGPSRAGFYASTFGFLPYTFSRDPLDVFYTVEKY